VFRFGISVQLILKIGIKRERYGNIILYGNSQVAQRSPLFQRAVSRGPRGVV
jgi:hypothetical protein